MTDQAGLAAAAVLKHNNKAAYMGQKPCNFTIMKLFKWDKGPVNENVISSFMTKLSVYEVSGRLETHAIYHT